MKKAVALPVLLSVAALLLGALALGAGLVYRAATSPLLIEPPQVISVEPGTRTLQVARTLETRGVVSNARVLALLAKLRGLDTEVRHGEHLFGGWMTPEMVLEELIRAPRRPGLRLTIPEGLRIEEIGELLESRGLASSSDYRNSVCSAAFIKAAAADRRARCAEGFLFPDTYEIAEGASAADIAGLQLARFKQVVEPLIAESYAADGDLAAVSKKGSPSLTAWRNRVVTLASIVEKESGRAEERPLIAGVFANRLRNGMKLQTDPTVIYGIIASGQPWDGNLTRKHLDEPGPYNTYQIPELPPGPICNPGLAAVEAVLSPAASDYLYFVARGDGSHEFSRSYAEHRRAVRKYQLN